ncbi:MAG: electron transport complex subunit RsxC [Eubacteriales bacterium]|nr:electron transport complex subunit RsxC [Eubacteriales bacterium]
MAKHTFLGGVELYGGKEAAREKPIRTIFPEGEMVYPLLQHIGRPAIPVVAPGDFVLTGQRIAKADGELSADLHSSVSGTVKAIEEREDVSGKWVRSIVVDNDRRYEEIYYPEKRRLSSLGKYEILQAVRDAGVVGMGGAGLPTHIKLDVPQRQRIDYVIANGVECEPYQTGNFRRMVENPAKIINGLKILQKLFPRARSVMAVGDDQAECYALFKQLTREDPQFLVKRLRTKYPQGSERQLIYALTGRTLNAKMLPYEIGCIVLNIDTLVAINQAVMVREPLLTRIVTVGGDAAAAPQNLRVRIGMSYRELLEKAGGLRRAVAMQIVGGPMQGRTLATLDAPVTKRASSLLCLSRDRAREQRETACIRCGRCVLACPNRLVPVELYRDVLKGREDSFISHNGLECNGCGCCSYVCPAKRELSYGIEAMREQVLLQPEKAGDYARRYIGVRHQDAKTAYVEEEFSGTSGAKNTPAGR